MKSFCCAFFIPFLFLSSLLFFCRCDNKKEPRYLLPDKFLLRDIKTTRFDRSKIIFNQFDSAEKMKFVVPVTFGKERDWNELDYFIHWQAALPLSVQKNVGRFTPVIIEVSGDDYEAEYMILLDADNHPVSALLVAGCGLCGGPYEIGDSLLRTCPDRSSAFKGNEIFTTVVTSTFRPDSVRHKTIIDSVNYRSLILEDGKFSTKLVDSTRYERFEF